MFIRNQRDFGSAVMFVVFGLMFIFWSSDYAFGSAQRMGPGYFPTVLGWLLVAIGVAVGAPAIGRVPASEEAAAATRLGGIGWRGLVIILGAVALYGILLPRLGFVISLAVLIIGSAAASPEFSWRETLLSTVVLAIGSYLTFVKGLELQFSVWPPFLVG